MCTTKERCRVPSRGHALGYPIRFFRTCSPSPRSRPFHDSILVAASVQDRGIIISGKAFLPQSLTYIEENKRMCDMISYSLCRMIVGTWGQKHLRMWPSLFVKARQVMCLAWPWPLLFISICSRIGCGHRVLCYSISYIEPLQRAGARSRALALFPPLRKWDKANRLV
jgi:hypothetical protein